MTSRPGARYKPRGRNLQIAEVALSMVQSVPYSVTSRWVFYRLLQSGYYTSKSEYTTWIQLSSRLRKAEWEGWQPDTIIDESRDVHRCGYGVASVQDWIDQQTGDSCELDHWYKQENYVECWFEAAAMRGQFQRYAPGITLRPFKGEFTIEPKWRAAKDLEAADARYGKPIVVCYFGDWDWKGTQIDQNALTDIYQWCGVPFEFDRIGLNKGDGERLGIPTSLEGSGFQWEALDDAAAEAMIQDGLAKYMDLSLVNELNEAAEEASDIMQSYMDGFPDYYESHRTTEDE